MPHQERDQSFNTFVDGQCDQLELAWKSGVTPDLRQFLPPQETSSRRELLQQLILVDCWYRREAGLDATLASYLEEARIAAQLDHPAIIPIHDVGSTPEIPCFVVSKLISGADLMTCLDRGQVFSLDQIIDIVSRISDALHYAHTKGLIHRDIKPANILIDEEDKAFLADFGIAMRDANLGSGPEYVGTMAYMSPEQISGTSH